MIVNARFAYSAEVQRRNASKIANYEAQWKVYAAARDARPEAANLIAPVPDYAEAVGLDEHGWAYIFTAGERVIQPRMYLAPVKTAPDWFTAGSSGSAVSSAPDPFNVPVTGRVKHGGMEFMRIA